MKIKKLVWKDNVTEVGKEQGMLEITSKVDTLGLNYKIRNYETYVFPKFPIPQPWKYYLFGSHGSEDIIPKEETTMEKAKELAQDHFEKIVMETFFETTG